MFSIDRSGAMGAVQGQILALEWLGCRGVLRVLYLSLGLALQKRH